MSEENLKLWKAVCETNPDAIKKVNQRGGFSAIDAYSQIYAATNEFGAVGVGWGWEVINIQYPPNDSIIVQINMWHGTRENCFPVFGQKKLNMGDKPDEDAAKKALTDAITKGLSYLGFNADVFLGYFDDNKYVERMAKKFNDPSRGNVSEAKKAMKAFELEVFACEDLDTFDLFIQSKKRLLDRFGEVIPEYSETLTNDLSEKRKQLKELSDVK